MNDYEDPRNAENLQDFDELPLRRDFLQLIYVYINLKRRENRNISLPFRLIQTQNLIHK